MGTITPKNAARLRIAKFAIPVIGALIYAVLYYLPMAPQLQALSPANSGFSVNLPCYAQSKTSQLDSGFGIQSQTDYFCAADGVHYVVGYTDIPAAVMAPLRQAHDTTPLLEAYKTLMLERSGGKLSSGYSYPTKGTYTINIMGERGWLDRVQDRLPRWGRPSAPGHTHVMHVQAQLQGDRLFMLHVLQPDPPSYNQELYANRTLRSFQIAKK